jgi:selenium metabolism protein YedF
MANGGGANGRGPVVLIAAPGFGHGSDELGGILIRSFLKTLKELRPAPEALIFVNGGVQLTTEGSELIADLCAFAERGSQVLSCGTCLDYFGLKEELRAGRVSNMGEIVSTLAGASHIIRP